MTTPHSHSSSRRTPFGLDGFGFDDGDSSLGGISSANSPIESTPSPSFSGKDEEHSPSNIATEKRKRSRVTPEQLVELEKHFASDPSPTATRRREISHTLDMNERQTQIWFQNRRAKAKLLDRKANDARLAEAFPSVSLSNPKGDFTDLIMRDRPMAMIPCFELSIGCWRRICSPSQRDLIAYIPVPGQSVTWFIYSDGGAFKMEIPFNSIVKATFQAIDGDTGLVTFDLSRQPLFFLDDIRASRAGEPAVRTWKACSDWTEDRQASQVLQHRVVGPATNVAQLVHNIQSQRSPFSIPNTSTSLPATNDYAPPFPEDVYPLGCAKPGFHPAPEPYPAPQRIIPPSLLPFQVPPLPQRMTHSTGSNHFSYGDPNHPTPFPGGGYLPNAGEQPHSLLQTAPGFATPRSSDHPPHPTDKNFTLFTQPAFFQ